MAEFVLGLTNTAVAGTLSRVKSAIEEEAEIKERVQEDLEFITGEFEMMQSFLRGSNAVDRAAKNPVVQTWVRQLRDLAFDVEDCVDFVVHLDSPPWTNWLWRVVPSCCKSGLGAPPQPLDEAVAEIKRLKTRVQDVSQRNTRYNLMIDSTTTMMLPPPTISSSSSSEALRILSEVWLAAGKLNSTGTNLKDLITSAQGNVLQVVSLWPGRSHGTCADLHLSEVSRVIREAYNDPEIYSEFECRAWVKLTMSHPAVAAAFNTQELFLHSLMAQFCPSLSSDHLAAADCKAELMHQLNTKRYLLVIQGISTLVEWDAIKMYMPDNNNGSRIILSTQQLTTALLCTGEPYKVSELACFSDGQSLCAFSKVSVLRKDIGELIWQIRRGGVISVLGDLGINKTYSEGRISELYKFLMYKHKDLEGVLVFKEQSWVDVPNPFDLMAFCVRLFLNFQSHDFQAKEIAAVGLEGVAERCRKYLVEGDCLVVINGLESKEHWDRIKETFLLSRQPMAEDTSIIVITKEASVAAHCADQQNRCLTMNDVQTDNFLFRYIQDKSGCGIGGKEDSRRAHLLYHDRNNVFHQCSIFKLLGRKNEVSALERQIKKAAGVISVWGQPGVGKSAIARVVYYENMMKNIFYRNVRVVTDISWVEVNDFSWVDVPNRPFDLTDFSWHLLLGFYSHDLEAKERAGIAMLRGEDPIPDCCQILRQKKCLVVIDGLRSKCDWDKIDATFLSSQPSTLQGYIVVITDKRRVARHCVVDEEEDRVIHVKRLAALHRPLTNGPSVRRLSERGEEACGWAAEFDLVGREEEINTLSNVLVDGPCLFSLWGVAGVGKSALVRKAHPSWYMRSMKHSWVDVPDPFDLGEFSHRLLLGFHSNDLQAKEIAAVSIMEGHDTAHESSKIMRESACLVVIDGLRSTHDWDLIRAAFFSETNQGRRIIVITNEASIAMHCVHDKSHVLNVKGLNATDALHLFRKIAWCGKQKLTRVEKELSEPIIAKCGALPEVIGAIGEYTAEGIARMGRNDETLRKISLEIHHDFMGKLETDSRFQSLRGLFCWMWSYFDACPDSLKPCIFYLSVFPVGHNMRRRRLLRRWIAEGYSRDTSIGVTAEDKGEMLFAELIKLSIIQKQQQTPSNCSHNKKKIVIQVNGFYHGYIISRPMEENLVFALEERCSVNSVRRGQHLTIRSSWDRDKVVYHSIDFKRLRSLTVFGEWMSFFISTDINMRLLRVLDLEDTTSGVTDDVVEQIGKLLPRLKFLSLRGCKEITRIPDSFGGLRQLQTLDVRNTKIVALPRAIIKLVKLQYIYAGTTYEKSDEADDMGLPTSDDDDVMSTSSGESWTSMEGSDDTVAIPQVDHDGLIKSQPLSTTSVDGDETSRRQLAAAYGVCTKSNLPETAYCTGTSTSLEGILDGCGTSTSQAAAAAAAEDGDGTSTRQPAEELVTGQLLAAPIDGDNSRQPTTDGDGTSTSEASPVVVPATNSNDTSRRQSASAVDQASTTQAPWRRKARDVVVSYSHSLFSRKQKSHDNKRDDGVEIPAAALGKLTALHSLGIIDVGAPHGNGKAVMKELQKLTQLRKLRVSGINRLNWHGLCSAISGHGHIRSLYVRLDKDEDAGSFFSSSNDMFSDLPKTLQSLKLYTWGGHGTVQVSPVLVKHLPNLRKVDFELKISTQEDIENLVKLPNKGMFCSLCVKPTQDGEFRYGWWDTPWLSEGFTGDIVLKIDCGVYNSHIVFGPTSGLVQVLVVHCSSMESSLKVTGLETLHVLKKVMLKGFYSEEVKNHLQQQVDDHWKKPVLKLEDRESHQYPEPKGPSAPRACCHTYASCCFNGSISTCK